MVYKDFLCCVLCERAERPGRRVTGVVWMLVTERESDVN